MRLSTLTAVAAAVAFAPLATAQTTFPSTGAAIPIPDGAVGGTACGDPGLSADMPITVTSAGTITDLNVRLNITHTWLGDIEATVSKGATSVIVVDNPGAATPTACGNSSDNIPGVILDDEATLLIGTGPFPLVAGTGYKPSFPLTVFDGQTVAGAWTMSVTDGGEADTGTLNSWALIATLSGVAGEDGALPAGYAFELSGSNPARTSTQFNVAVAQTQTVRVALYDALGREVRVAFDQIMAEGQTAFVAVRVDDLPAGTYVARATGTGFAATVPLTVVR